MAIHVGMYPPPHIGSRVEAYPFEHTMAIHDLLYEILCLSLCLFDVRTYMYVNMYIYMYVNMYTYLYVRKYVYLFVCMYTVDSGAA